MSAIVAKLHVSSPYYLNYLKLYFVKKFLVNWMVPTKYKFEKPVNSLASSCFRAFSEKNA